MSESPFTKFLQNKFGSWPTLITREEWHDAQSAFLNHIAATQESRIREIVRQEFEAMVRESLTLTQSHQPLPPIREDGSFDIQTPVIRGGDAW